MTKLALVLLLFSIGIAIQLVHSTKEVDEWIQKLHHAKEKVSTLHFYFHDTLSRKNPSAVEVVEASMTKKSPSLFGLLNIFDDLLTEGLEPTSMLVGRAQGLYGSVGQKELSLLMAMNFVFTIGNSMVVVSLFWAGMQLYNHCVRCQLMLDKISLVEHFGFGGLQRLQRPVKEERNQRMTGVDRSNIL
ncbi:dirigent protein 23 [Quercus suber]|uniref:Dirigent protein n=1 Tax=Quercus suber TaxID=58331 RepID=A0AAW0KSK6_QUESU